MRVAIGTTVIASGTASGEPARLDNAIGSKVIQTITRVGAPKGAFAERGNRSYTDTVIADYSYTTAADAKAGIIARRIAALSATGSLTYGSGSEITTVGAGTVSRVELVEWSGCGFTLRYTILAVES